MMRIIICITLLLGNTILLAQQDSSSRRIEFGGYLENYYSFDFDQPETNDRPPFLYSYNRHNEVALNLGYIKATYKEQKVMASIALMTGTYVNANLAEEPGVLQNILEAYAGVKISEKDLWLYAGTFSSHIGFESAVGKDCWNLSRSILAENSPYYESGIRINYSSKNSKWFLSGLALNGWQRMQRIEGNNSIAFGHQITFKPNAKITLNSSSFVGNVVPDDEKKMRYFHNFYGQFQVSEKVGFIVGFDSGVQQRSKGSSTYNSWYSPVFIARYSPAGKTNLAIRVEYYSDEGGVIIQTDTPNGFRTLGYSLNLDYNINKNVVWRIEGRGFKSKDRIFETGNEFSNTNAAITTSLAVSF
jgi:hypothetical protein